MSRSIKSVEINGKDWTELIAAANVLAAGETPPIDPIDISADILCVSRDVVWLLAYADTKPAADDIRGELMQRGEKNITSNETRIYARCFNKAELGYIHVGPANA